MYGVVLLPHMAMAIYDKFHDPPFSNILYSSTIVVSTCSPMTTGSLCQVHGSLARAGKVRGQTPKVEAGEKKKKKTGRAKRRIQYNRR